MHSGWEAKGEGKTPQLNGLATVVSWTSALTLLTLHPLNGGVDAQELYLSYDQQSKTSCWYEMS